MEDNHILSPYQDWDWEDTVPEFDPSLTRGFLPSFDIPNAPPGPQQPQQPHHLLSPAVVPAPGFCDARATYTRLTIATSISTATAEPAAIFPERRDPGWPPVAPLAPEPGLAQSHGILGVLGEQWEDVETAERAEEEEEEEEEEEPRRCCQCNKVKPRSEFPILRDDKRRGSCDPCARRKSHNARNYRQMRRTEKTPISPPLVYLDSTTTIMTTTTSSTTAATAVAGTSTGMIG